MSISKKSFKKDLSIYIFYGLLAYMPFHVFLSTWIGSSFGILTVAKVIKEPVLIIGFLSALFASKGRLLEIYKNNKIIFNLIACYELLTLMMTVFFENEIDAKILGLSYNLRFLIFFIYGLFVADLHGTKVIKKSLTIIISSGLIVAVFGLAQVLLLPDSALTHFGYSEANGTPATFYISPITRQTERAYSTLKDPNSLGSYLIIIIMLALMILYDKSRKFRYSAFSVVKILFLLACMLLTYSRSGFVGLGVAGIGAVLYFLPKSGINVRKFFMPMIFTILLIVASVLMLSSKGTGFYRSVILHDEDGKEHTSNSIRLDSYKKNTEKVLEKPLGYGVGAAGPVSFKNESKGAMIPENYYIQVALETGLIGLIVFSAIIVIVGTRLYKLSKYSNNLLALALLVSLFGISVSNLFNHIWANEAVAYTWWGLAGIVHAGSAGSDKNTKIKKQKI